MADGTPPIVRTTNVCERTVTEGQRGTLVSLLRLVHTLYPDTDPPYPHRRRLLSIFAQLSECRGECELRFDIHQEETDEVIWTSSARRVRFQNQPLQLHGLPLQIRDCLFPSPGIYWVQLIWNDVVIAQQRLTLARTRPLRPDL